MRNDNSELNCLQSWLSEGGHSDLHSTAFYVMSSDSGLQLIKSEQNGFHDNFLISQPNL